MKSNRQIGLNGKSTITSCLRRSLFFVYGLMLSAAFSAAGDLMKLLGASGADLSGFNTGLLLFDFIASLTLILAMFFAAFMDCGQDIPRVGGKPLVLFGYLRIGYYITFCYCLCFRALYYANGLGEFPPAMLVFYAAYFLMNLLAVIALAFFMNMLIHDVVRRSYIHSFKVLAGLGFAAGTILLAAYIASRITMRDITDEFFTPSFADFLRLFAAPLCYFSTWMICLSSSAQVGAVFDEADAALRNKQYQIVYGELPAGKKEQKRRKKAIRAAKVHPAALPPKQQTQVLPPVPPAPAPEAAAQEKPGDPEKIKGSKNNKGKKKKKKKPADDGGTSE